MEGDSHSPDHGRFDPMQRLFRRPSPALVIACLSLFVSLGGVSYAVATIDSADIVDGSIRNRDFKDGTLRGQ